MGTWGLGPFDNDNACDWKHEVEVSSSPIEALEVIQATLQKVLDEQAFSSPDADRAIAAADTVSRLRGHFYVRNAYTRSLDEWISRSKTHVSSELTILALDALARIINEPSEILEFWEGDEAWLAQIDALNERLLESLKK